MLTGLWLGAVCVGGVACGGTAAPTVDVDAGVDGDDAAAPDATPDADLCTTNACGGCGPLAHEPGAACGGCDTGVWACTADGGVRCEGDLGRLARNACGGCSRLGQAPDQPCGTCNSGITACVGPDDVACLGDTGDLARNGCRGCGELAGDPGQACGTCDTGNWVCAGENTTICHDDVGPRARNACGGCTALQQPRGEPCGTCGRWACGADADSLVCAGDVTNACGGCGALAAEPGGPCGSCGSGRLVCAGPNEVGCDADLGQAARNDCGGCASLPRTGEPCGQCLFGAWSCTDTDSVECLGDEGTCFPGFVEVPAGTFTRGSPLFETCRSEDEVAHEVSLREDFWLGAFEVTRAQWAELMGGPVGDCSTCPVDKVGLYDAVVYANALSARHGLRACYELDGCVGDAGSGCDGSSCDGLRCASLALIPGCDGYRLPTEAQWEYAARAGSQMATWAGELDQRGCDSADPVLESIAWSCHDPVSEPQPVGHKAANPWRVFDMLGNVAEWTHDGYAPYPADPVTDPTVPIDGYAVVRGGHVHLAACALRAARRTPSRPWRRQTAVGFRLVR